MQNNNTSGFITDVGYDSMSESLRVSFQQDGNKTASYSYGSVPRNIADGLLAAPSKGKYFNSNIRGRFPATRVVS
jgi:hypothetical protein